jgi:pilus assembly protein FimV
MDEHLAPESVPAEHASEWTRTGTEHAAGFPGEAPLGTADRSIATNGKGDPDEVDPLLESEVYLACGKHKEAEETMKNAIREHPERGDYQLKLLEIYAAAGHPQEFQDYALKLHLLTEFRAPNFWKRVKEMGQQLCPANPLFRNGSEEMTTSDLTGAGAGVSAQTGDNTDQLIADLKRFSVAAREKRETSGPEPSGEKQRKTLIEPPSALPEPEPLTLSQPDPKLRNDRLTLVDHEPLVRFESLAGHSRAGSPSPDSGHGHNPASGDITLQDDLESTESRSLRMELGCLQGDSQLGDDADEPTVDGRDLEAKLDLARAYADMEDYGHAKELLGEVMSKGNEQQEREATHLWSRISQL